MVSRQNEVTWRKHVAKAAVVRAPSGEPILVSPEVLLTLVVMAHRMSGVPIYSSGRGWLMGELGISEATLGRRLREAVAVGLLGHLARGREGQYAEYQGLFPELVTGPEKRQAKPWKPPPPVPRKKRGDPLGGDHHGGPPLLVSRRLVPEDLDSDDPPPF